MKTAVILTARKERYADRPYPLIPFDGTTCLIDRNLALLKGLGYTRIYIVAGYKAELFDKYRSESVQVLINPEYEYTSSMSSLAVVRDYVDETKADLERQITAKADKAYVNAVKAEIEASIDDKVEEEKLRAEAVEAGIANELRQETLRAVNKENIISNNLAHTSNIVKALTDWDGDDRADYTDIGNGIVDVMHRELHQVRIDTATTLFADAVYYRYDNKIRFRNKNGDDICSIDVSDFAPTVIDRTWYANGIIYIQFTNGEIVEIDVKKLIDENEFADGLQVIDGIVSVKKDPTSESYLSVSINGIKISGIDVKFTRLEEKIDRIASGTSEEIAAERDRAIHAETVLGDRITNEVSRATSAESTLNTKIDDENTRAITAEEALDDKINNITIDCGIY